VNTFTEQIAPKAPLIRAGLTQVVILLLLAGIPTWLTSHFQIRWKAPATVESLTISSLKQDTHNVIWIDVRGQEAFDIAHIEGALRFDENDHDTSLQTLLKEWTPDKRVVVYGVGTGSERAERVALRLKKDLQSKKVYLLEGGWASWPRN